QTCSDNTPYNQCSNTQPLFCYNNGTLGNRCQQCRCPQQQICQADGSCSGSPNQPPNATITQPTQNTFTVNTPINYAGTGTDPDGTIVSYSWTVDIIGDGQQPFTIGNQQSGTYTPTTLVNNLSTIYRLTLTVTDNDQAPGTNFKELTIVPAQQNLFDFNSIINYLGVVSDPNGPIPNSQMTWEYDITGDNQGPISLGIGPSGSFIANRTIGAISLYKLRFTANDGQYTNFSERDIIVLSEPTQTECQLTSALWQETNVNESTLVNLIVNGSNCNSKLVNFVVWEDDILDGDDPVQ
ncbi:hypothetical protein J4455_05675, partial [Candidatus Woesearchaeota archaeon]|nr:hypothetical protein [Candidatus Woesearchaeota archaeon]